MRGVVAALALVASACGGSDGADSGLDPQADVDSAAVADSDSAASGGGVQAAAGTDGSDPGIAGDSGVVGGDSGVVAGVEGTVGEVEESPPGHADQDDVIALGERVADGAGSVSDNSYADGYAGYIAPLTGLPANDPAAAHRRALAVKVGNNQRSSRPQAGLAEADVVYEMLIEGVRTRFVAVYHSEVPTRIGPVRSARSSDIDLMPDLGQPYFVSSGGNGKVLGQISSAAREGILIDGSATKNRSYFKRDKNRRAPYNLYFEYTEPAGSETPILAAPDDDGNLPVHAVFEYAPRDTAGAMDSKADFDWLDNGGSDGSSASDDADEARTLGIKVGYRGSSGASAVHIWDDEVQGWVRIQDGTLHVAETDSGVVEIAPANVLVLMAGYKRSSADPASPHVLSYDTGEAWLLTDGAVTEAVWERTEDRVGFRLADSDGKPLALTPGKTWVLFANRGRSYSVAKVELISAVDGEQLLAEARAAFDAG